MAYNRKEIVKRIREEGAEAKRQGKSCETNPYEFTNQYQWLRGYHDEPRNMMDCVPELTVEERLDRLEKLLGVK